MCVHRYQRFTEAGFKERERTNERLNYIPHCEYDRKISRVLEDVAKAPGVNSFKLLWHMLFTGLQACFLSLGKKD